jgi:NADPH2:quinone reductase
MLIRWCKALGIRTINIVRKAEQVDELKALGADYVLNSNDEGLIPTITQLREEVGATIGFDCIGGDLSGAVFECLARNGKMYVYGSMSDEKLNMISPIGLIFLNKSIQRHGLPFWLVETGDWHKQSVIKEALGLAETVLKTEIVREVNVMDIRAALGEYQSNMSAGKINIALKFN